MHRVHLIVPGDLGQLTGGYGYDRRIADGLRALGWEVPVHGLAGAFPDPDDATLTAAAATLAAIPDGERVLMDGLALGVMPSVVAAEAARLRLIGLVHHPLTLEAGLSPARAAALHASESAALAATRGVVVTSPATGRLLAEFGVVPARVAVVLPGTDPAPLARLHRGLHQGINRGQAPGPLRLLCVATLIPRKGHRWLMEALAALSAQHPALDWQLDCIGSLDRCPATAKAVAAQIQASGLAGRVRLLGEVDDACLARAYAAADLFVLPSLFEGYGMAFAEALARGLPVLGCDAGAVPDTVPATTGRLVPPGDGEALRAALAELMLKAGLRAQLARGGAAARRQLPDWPASAARMATALIEMTADA